MLILFFVGIALAVIGIIIYLSSLIMITIDAFNNKPVQGILSLFIPFYCFYYLFTQYKKDNKKSVILLLFAGLILMILGIVFIGIGSNDKLSESTAMLYSLEKIVILKKQ